MRKTGASRAQKLSSLISEEVETLRRYLAGAASRLRHHFLAASGRPATCTELTWCSSSGLSSLLVGEWKW